MKQMLAYKIFKMERKSCCEKEGAWSPEEEETLTNYVQVHGEGNWKNLPQRAGLNRCGESCKHRWLNYLKQAMYEENFSWDEEELIIKLHKLLGNRWSIIAGRLPGRTEIEIERFWNIRLSKKVEENYNNEEFPSIENPFDIDHAESSHHVIKPKVVKLNKALKPTHNGTKL